MAEVRRSSFGVTLIVAADAVDVAAVFCGAVGAALFARSSKLSLPAASSAPVILALTVTSIESTLPVAKSNKPLRSEAETARELFASLPTMLKLSTT